jgi:hypothetical protein
MQNSKDFHWTETVLVPQMSDGTTNFTYIGVLIKSFNDKTIIYCVLSF